jgi:hypothetical protein
MSRRIAVIALLVVLAFSAAPTAFADYPPISASLTNRTLAVAAVPAGSISPTPQVFLWQYGRNPIQLTHSRYYVTHPRFSPDGRHLAVNDGNQVAVIDLINGLERVLVPGPRKFLGDWSPDGRYLCYTSMTWVEEWDDFFFPRVWIVDARSGETWQIPDQGFNQRNPTWGPTGEIAYEEWGNGPLPTIRGYNPFSDEERELVPTDGPEGAQWPAWTSEGCLYYGNYPRPNEQDEMGTIYYVEEFPGRGEQVAHNFWQWGYDVPEATTPEGDLFYYSLGDAPWSTYHIFKDRFGTLWALDHIIGLNYWCGSITITASNRVHDRWWRNRRDVFTRPPRSRP